MKRASLPADRVFLWSVFASVVVFIVFGVWALGAPGLYMDAINPDYEVVKLVDPNAPVTIWEIPGNLVFSRFPILFGLYGGSYAVYWAVPFYLFFGGSIASVRIGHIFLGLVLFCIIAFVTRRLTKSNLITGLVIVALALDPVFIYSLRTQAFEVLFSSPLLVGSIYALYRFPNLRGYFASSLLLGLAAFGYFVNFFALPGLVLFAIRDRDVRSYRLRFLATFFAGLCVGVVPYFLGYGLIFSSMGFGPGMDWLHGSLGSLHVSGDTSYVLRIVSVASNVSKLLNSDWLWQTFWQEPHADLGQAAKALLFVLLPLVALVSKRPATRVSRAFAAIAFPSYSFVLIATYFGSRLGAHDLIAIVPLTYLAVAVAIPVLLEALPEYRALLGRAFLALGALVLGSNAIASASVAARLSSDHGNGLYSEIFSDLADRALNERSSEPYIFWDWGEMMPFIYRTHGQIPAFSSDQFAAVLCRYGTTDVVFLGDDASGASSTFSLKGLTVVKSVLLHDSSSNYPMRILTVRSSVQADGCATKVSAVSTISAAPAPTTKLPTVEPQPSLKMSTVSDRGVTFISEPAVVPYPQGGALPKITVRWKAPAVNRIEIHMGSPNGALFAAAGNDGSQATGAWMQPGVRFYLQDVDSGTPGRTLSTITASACANCRP